MAGYGQFCPVAKAMEVLDERWTMLVIRELLQGSTRFSQLRKGVPRMSPGLLTTRLRSLERAGIVTRELDRGHPAYRLTEPGRDLIDVVHAIGLWGLQWITDLGQQDLDPHLLMWDIRRTLPVQAWPRARTVVAIRFNDVPARESRWWLIVDGGEADVCDSNPGFEVAAHVVTGLVTLVRIWRGETTWANALRESRVSIEAPPTIRRAVPGWFGRSGFADLAETRRAQ